MMNTCSPLRALARLRRRSATRAMLLLPLAALPLCAAARAGAASTPARAHATRTVNVTDTAHLRYRRSSGSYLVEEGSANGGVPGLVKVRFYVGATVSATFTIYTHNGALSGHGSGKLHSSGMYASFGGSMIVTSGTGRYANAHGRGGFYGVINRKTYALTVQTTGKLSY